MTFLEHFKSFSELQKASNGYVNRAAPEMLVVAAALAGAAPVEQMLGGLSAAISGVRSVAFCRLLRRAAEQDGNKSSR